ncbi:MAG TPA: hypothetical protein VEV87_03005 [Chitinophagaceae bacterium]|nr:hypothetical protein [Chitinophagaceae bacterium]
MQRLFLTAFIFVTVNVYSQSSAKSITTTRSQWVYPGKDGKLIYKSTENGDRILDFSYAGYMGGGVSIPSPLVKVELSPLQGDNTDAIQKAIDDVSKLKVVNGFRGTVLLKGGIYNCERTININTSGVVLRGSGPGEKGSVINMTGKPHLCISARGNVKTITVGEPTTITDAYVPSGTHSFKVASTAGLRTGDTIRITKPVTDAWVNFMGMDKMVRNGKPQTWITGEINIERVIRKIDGNKITVDVPLTDNYDAKYLNPPGTSVSKISSTGELSQIGIENLRIKSSAQSVTISEGHHRAFTMSGIADSWARNIDVFNTVNSISVTGKRITVEQVNVQHDVPTIGAAKPADLNGSGVQLLFNKCTITGDNLFFFGTGAKVSGPVVLLNCVFRGNGWIQPHQRWATGLLVDNCHVPDGGIDFMNRGSMGSGHGWAIGWAVAWNCKAKSYLNQQPPGSANWVIGSSGQKQKRAIPFDSIPYLPEGIYDAYELPVAPQSLYLAQLEERVGKKGVQNIGY